MKKITYLLVTALLAAAVVQAQDYKKFKVGVGLGYAMASGDGSSGGLIFALEPAYRLQDNFAIGLRMESAIITRGFSVPVTAFGASISAAGITSYTLNGQYYFGTSNFRPFLGAGLGMYSLAAVSLSAGGGSGDASAAESKFGFYPRAGFDLGHFNVTLDYNLIPSTAVTGSTDVNIKNNYFGIRVGAFFGGGKK